MKWQKVATTACCSKCGKKVWAGRLLGIEAGEFYCYRCGSNKELSGAHRRFSRLDGLSSAHLKAIQLELISK